MKRFGSQLSCRISSDMLRRAPISRAYALVGKLVWKSLKTATFSVAKQRLPDTLRDHRSKIESLTAFAEGKMTVGNAADVYLQKIRASISLKPRSKEYRELMTDFIRRSWPSQFETDGARYLHATANFGSADINSGTLQVSSTTALAACELFSIKRSAPERDSTIPLPGCRG